MAYYHGIYHGMYHGIYQYQYTMVCTIYHRNMIVCTMAYTMYHGPCHCICHGIYHGTCNCTYHGMYHCIYHCIRHGMYHGTSVPRYTIRIKWKSQQMDISKKPMFAEISYSWSLTLSICRSRAPEFKSGIETEPNRPNGCQKYGIQVSKLPKYKIEKSATKKTQLVEISICIVWYGTCIVSTLLSNLCILVQACLWGSYSSE